MPLAEAVNEGSGEPPCSTLKKEDFAALRFVNWTRKFSEFWKIRNSESRVKKNWKPCTTIATTENTVACCWRISLWQTNSGCW